MQRRQDKHGEGPEGVRNSVSAGTQVDGRSNEEHKHTGRTYQRVVPRLEGGVVRKGLLAELHHGLLARGPIAPLEEV